MGVPATTHFRGNPGLKIETWATHSKSRGSADFRQRNHGPSALRPTQGDDKQLLFSNYSPGSTALPLVIPTGVAARVEGPAVLSGLLAHLLKPLNILQQLRPGAVHVRHHSFFAVEQSVVDIGPELPQDKCRSVQADVCQPALAGLRPGALLFGIIEIRNT